MKTIIEHLLEWLWKHKPDVAFVGVLLACTVWITLSIENFNDRLDRTERLCNDIDQHQLPEIRSDIRQMKEDIVEIKLFMKKMDTYLATTSDKYPK